MSTDYHTVRRHPRTTGEAFKDASYADPIDLGGPDDRVGWGGVLLATALGLVGACALVAWGVQAW